MSKSIDVTRRLLEHSRGPVTVSTLREAEYFATHGIVDGDDDVALSVRRASSVTSGKGMDHRGRGVDRRLRLVNKREIGFLDAAEE
jgi:hypothetical protein